MKAILVILLLTILYINTGTSLAMDSTRWQEINTNQLIICQLEENSSPQKFLLHLKEKQFKADMNPGSIFVIDTITVDATTFIVRKRLRRYLKEYHGFSTLSTLEILTGFKDRKNMLLLMPLKKKNTK